MINSAQLIILDFDGTLADTRPLILRTMQRTAVALGLPPFDEAACIATIGLPLRECFARLMPTHSDTLDRAVSLYRQLFEEGNAPDAVVCFPHVEDTLRALHARGLRLAICSSRSRPSLLAFVERMGLAPYIGQVVGADDVQHPKPHPEPVQLILRAMGLPPKAAWVVGDASFDMAMGKAAGCHACGVTYGNQTAAELLAAGADCLVDDFAELLSFFPLQ